MAARGLSVGWWVQLRGRVRALTTRGPKGRDDARFVRAVFWVLRTGAPWRDLPSGFGKWSTVYRRYRRWAVAGRWEALRQTLDEQQRCYLLIDSTIIKAHPHAAGALKRGETAEEALGRSRGGFSTKLHALVTEHGRLVRYLLTGGEVNDITQAKQLVSKDIEGSGVVGDRAYDSNEFASHLEELELEVVIPSRANRVVLRRIDAEVYRRRNVIERWFGRLKQFRRIATRYDKTQSSYRGFIALGASQVALSGWRA
jgi:transposase